MSLWERIHGMADIPMFFKGGKIVFRHLITQDSESYNHSSFCVLLIVNHRRYKIFIVESLLPTTNKRCIDG